MVTALSLMPPGELSAPVGGSTAEKGLWVGGEALPRRKAEGGGRCY